jgi:hypothetical protein
MKKYLTDTVLTTKGQKEGKDDRKNRMSKRLMKAKEQAKKKEDESKFKKSDSITMRASLLESKLSSGSIGSAKPIEKIQEVNEEKDN